MATATTNVAHDSDETFRAANRAAIAHTRRTPDLGCWRRYGQDEAHDDAVRRFRWDPAVRAYLDSKDARRRDRKADDWHPTAEQALLSGAAEFLEDVAARLRFTWAWHAARVSWDELPAVYRAVFDTAHRLAAEDGTAGGENVRLVCRLAVDLIYQRTGRKYSWKTICKAAYGLQKLGVLRITIKSRQSGTVYNLLAGQPRELLDAMADTKYTTPACGSRGCVHGAGPPVLR